MSLVYPYHEVAWRTYERAVSLLILSWLCLLTSLKEEDVTGGEERKSIRVCDIIYGQSRGDQE